MKISLSKTRDDLAVICKDIHKNADSYSDLLDYCYNNKIALFLLNTCWLPSSDARFTAFNPNSDKNTYPSIKKCLKNPNGDKLFTDMAMKLKCPLIFAHAGFFKWEISFFNFENDLQQ